MMDWSVKKLGTEECSECGTVYSVTYRNLPEKDDGNFVCSCGNEMRSWRETGYFSYREIDD